MLELFWTNEATEQLPEGGDSITTTFSFLRLDILESDNYEMASDITRNVVESGVSTIDHVSQKEDRYSATVYLSDRPTRMDQVVGTVRGVVQVGDRSFTRVEPPEGTTRAADAFETLRELKNNATLVSVVGARREIEDWLIETVSSPRTVDDAGALVCTITFVEWRVASLEDVDAPAPRVERGRRQSVQGVQTGQPGGDDSPVPAAPAARQSALAAGSDVLQEILGIRDQTVQT